MTTLTPPRANIPIGWVQIGGKRVPVAIEPEWLRYLAQSLFDRAGATSGSGTSDLETAAFEDAGIDDIKVALARLADEMPLHQPAFVAADEFDSGPAFAAEIESLRVRVEALEQS